MEGCLEEVACELSYKEVVGIRKNSNNRESKLPSKESRKIQVHRRMGGRGFRMVGVTIQKGEESSER